MIADNSVAASEAFVKANVKRGTTLLTDGPDTYHGTAAGSRHHHPPGRHFPNMPAHTALLRHSPQIPPPTPNGDPR